MSNPSMQKWFAELRARPLEALIGISVFILGALGVAVKDVSSSVLALLFLIGLFYAGTWKRSWQMLSGNERWLLVGLLLFALSGFLSWFNAADSYEYVKQMGRYLRFAAAVPVYLYLRGRPVDLSGWLLAGVALSGYVYLVLALHGHSLNPDLPASSGYHHITFGDAAMLNAGIIGAMLVSMSLSRPMRVLLIGSMLCALYASVLSQARGAWIVVPVYLLLFGFYGVRFGEVKKRVLALALLLLFALLAVSPAKDVLVKRYDEAVMDVSQFVSGERYDTSIGGRLAMWDVAIDVWLENPLIGTGLGDYDEDLMRYQQSGRYTSIDVHGSVHNVFLQALTTTGLVGFVISLLVIILLPLRLFASAGGWRHPLALAGSVLTVSYALFGLSESWILRAPVVSMYVVYMAVLATAFLQTGTGNRGNTAEAGDSTPGRSRPKGKAGEL